MRRFLKRPDHQAVLTPVLVAAALLLLPGCTAVGPSRSAVLHAASDTSSHGIQIVNLSEAVLRQQQVPASANFQDVLGNAPPIGALVGPGDVLEITIWEAPPAALFGVTAMSSPTESNRSTSLPEFLVGPSGRISIPFAGLVPVAGRSLPQIENEITARLRGKAHLPQVMVRLTRNATATVTIVGDVTNSTRMPLTPKGEHILDALAAAGGTRQATNKITLQVSRGGQTYSMPLDTIIRDPNQNVTLRADDVLTALYQPYSFTVLGATGRNDEINFEATGVTLAQAMGRIGGLQDGRADPNGVFIFRWETPAALPGAIDSGPRDSAGRVPVIYRVDMKDPSTYFAMQGFRIHNGDVLYIANSVTAELQRFVGVIASTVLPIATVNTSVKN